MEYRAISCFMHVTGGGTRLKPKGERAMEGGLEGMSVYVRGAVEGHKRTHLESSHQGGGGQATGGVRAAAPPCQPAWVHFDLLCWL